jgi:hypothetical protein
VKGRRCRGAGLVVAAEDLGVVGVRTWVWMRVLTTSGVKRLAYRIEVYEFREEEGY